MLNRKLAGLMVATAFVALAGAMPAANAQMMPPPMQPPPDRVDFYSDMPIAEPGDSSASWSARRNVVDSDRYERLIHTSPAFRAARIRQECGSINEPDLHQQCVASFDE